MNSPSIHLVLMNMQASGMDVASRGLSGLHTSISSTHLPLHTCRCRKHSHRGHQQKCSSLQYIGLALPRPACSASLQGGTHSSLSSFVHAPIRYRLSCCVAMSSNSPKNDATMCVLAGAFHGGLLEPQRCSSGSSRRQQKQLRRVGLQALPGSTGAAGDLQEQLLALQRLHATVAVGELGDGLEAPVQLLYLLTLLGFLVVGAYLVVRQACICSIPLPCTALHACIHMRVLGGAHVTRAGI